MAPGASAAKFPCVPKITTSSTTKALSVIGPLTLVCQLLWQTKVNGPITDSALVVDDVVIFGTQGNFAADAPGAIYGLDANTGKVLWKTTPQPNDPLSQIWGSATQVGDNVAIGVAS